MHGHRGYVGRLAPSPSGPLHLGILRSSLIAWLDARLAGGRLILRIEDIDQGRCKPEYTAQIIQDLAWFGLDWDEGPDRPGSLGPYLQSEREADYEAAIARLKALDRIYLCSCSRKEIALASAPHSDRDEGPRYPGTCRNGLRPKPGRGYAIRFKTQPEDRIDICDRRLGPLSQDLATEVGDFVLRRSDGLWAYQLAVTVDDLNQGIRCVVRGEDLMRSTPRQLCLRRLLDPAAPPLESLHLPLMRDETGRRLAKRDGDLGISAIKAAKKRPEALWAELAASLGIIGLGQLRSPRDLLEPYARWLSETGIQKPRTSVA